MFCVGVVSIPVGCPLILHSFLLTKFVCKVFFFLQIVCVFFPTYFWQKQTVLFIKQCCCYCCKVQRMIEKYGCRQSMAKAGKAEEVMAYIMLVVLIYCIYCYHYQKYVLQILFCKVLQQRQEKRRRLAAATYILLARYSIHTAMIYRIHSYLC